MNRFAAKLAKGSARLAFWRKRVEAAPEQPQPSVPETAKRAEPARAETPAPVDVPRQPGWFARLKHTLRRRKAPAQEPAPESRPATIAEPAAAPARPARNPVEAPAAADNAAPAKPSFLARLMRRRPKPAQLEAAAVADQPAAEKAGAEKRPARSAVEAPVTADTVAPAKASFFARLMRRQPKAAQLEAAAVADQPAAEKAGAGKRTAAKPNTPEPAAKKDEAATDPANVVPTVSFLARLKNKLRRQPAPEHVAADTEAVTHGSEKSKSAKPALAEPEKPKPEKASLTEDAQAAEPADAEPRVSFAARLKNKLRRQPRQEHVVADADAAQSASEPAVTPSRNRASAGIDADPEPADEAEAPPPGRVTRLLGPLTNKWVWIPALATVLIGVMAAMMVMLIQSSHEKAQLQAKLVATQQALKQTSVAKPAAVAAQPLPSAQPSDAVHTTVASAADFQSGGDTGDCDVSSKESAAKNLKNCIEAFNAISR